jgi:glycosyltransferase involved in cell wall biosynthesis
MTSAAIDWVGVVVPAHNEADYLPSCLDALSRAVERVPVAVDVVIVLDACVDASHETARAFRTVQLDAHNVGVARRTGFAALLAARPESIPDARSWLATTDADTLVPPDWLTRMIAYAEDGWEAVAGTVMVADWSEHWGPKAEAVRACWLAGYNGTDHHSHVHGANLGLRADCYREIGGMPGVAVSEDASLIAALAAAGRRVRHAANLPVVTSSRHSPRAIGGFGTFLRELSA